MVCGSGWSCYCRLGRAIRWAATIELPAHGFAGLDEARAWARPSSAGTTTSTATAASDTSPPPSATPGETARSRPPVTTFTGAPRSATRAGRAGGRATGRPSAPSPSIRSGTPPSQPHPAPSKRPARPHDTGDNYLDLLFQPCSTTELTEPDNDYRLDTKHPYNQLQPNLLINIFRITT